MWMRVQNAVGNAQEYYQFVYRGLAAAFRRPFYAKDLVEQMDYAGAGTMGIIVLVSLFTGMALSLQIFAIFSQFGLQIYTGRVVGIAVISEIGPVLTALVFAGRAGSGMASELGAMVLRNQVDTLRVFGVNPVNKLVVPRLLCSFLMLPALTVIGDFVSVISSYYITVIVYQQSASVFWDAVALALRPIYVTSGSAKPFVFGLIIASMSCYTGLSTSGGAAGLRRSTTRAFVLSTIFIIIADFITTKIVFTAFKYIE